jgi:hypothetical protein
MSVQGHLSRLQNPVSFAAALVVSRPTACETYAFPWLILWFMKSEILNLLTLLLSVYNIDLGRKGLANDGDAHLGEMHVDTDEGNAAGLKNDDLMEIVPKH